MKIIFLDFNGVLDTWEYIDEIDQGNLERLKKLADETEASVVFSSSIRYTRFGKKIMSEIISNGIDIVGVTPKLGRREEEVKAYLEEHPEVENYCIIDDDYFMESLKENMVKLPTQTIGSLGFTEEYYKKALNILGLKKDKEYILHGR